MADFPSSRRSHPSHFSYRKGREEILEIKALRSLSMQIFKPLGSRFSAERADSQRLCFAASKERASMSPGKDRLFNVDGPDVFESSSVHSFFLVQNHFSHDRRLEVLEREHHIGFLIFRLFLGQERLDEGLFDFREGFFPFLFGGNAEGWLKKREGCAFYGSVDLVWDFAESVELFGFPDFFAPSAQLVADFTDRFLPHFDRFDDLIFGQEIAETFNHEDCIFGTRNDEIEARFFHLFGCRIDDEMSVDHPHPDCADWFYERDI